MTMAELLRLNETNITRAAIIAISQKEVANQYVTDERTIADYMQSLRKNDMHKAGEIILRRKSIYNGRWRIYHNSYKGLAGLKLYI